MIRNPGAAGRITCKSTITLNARRNLFEKTQRNLGRLVQRAFSLKNRRVGGGGSSVAYKFTIKMKPGIFFLPEKETISPGWAGMTCKFTVKMKPRRILHEKTQGFLRRSAGVTCSPSAFYMRKHEDFSGVGGGLRSWCILIRNRDMVTYLGLAYILRIQVGWVGWVGWVGRVGRVGRGQVST